MTALNEIIFLLCP